MDLRSCILRKKSASAQRIHALRFVFFESANITVMTLFKAEQEGEYMFALANDLTNIFL